MKKSNRIFTLDLVILGVLEKKDSYGYEIVSLITKKSEGKIKISEGVMYPILYKLLDSKEISSYEIKNGKMTKIYYHIEEKGVSKLRELEKDFFSNVKIIQSLLKGEDE